MPFLHLVYIARSDGAISTVTGKAKRKEDNGPTSTQLQKTKIEKGVYSWYQELPIGDPKNLDWRRKLGGLLVKEVHARAKENGTKPASGPGSESSVNPEEYVLAAFPENYRLFEHRRAANLDNSNVRGPNDRRDVYLYGHPQGRKKRFRSPADFLPHLIWLSTDESGDPENCACKLCTPDEMIKAGEEMALLQKKASNGSVKVEEERKPAKPSVAAHSKDATSEQQIKGSTITVAPKAQSQPSTPAPPGLSRPPKAEVVSSQPKPQVSNPQAVPTPPVAARNSEQRLDQQVHKYVYRNGELVWYITTEGHLALGAIISRSLFKDAKNQDKPAYVIQPISYPFHHPTGLITTQEHEIKPWLAYSTPSSSIVEVGDGEIMYDQVNWGAVATQYASQSLIRAGSICAARMVDASYTLLQPLGKVEPGAREIQYNGMYLGGELIWVGEAVRLHTRDDTRDIMIVSNIIEKPGPSWNQSAAVEFIGDTYRPSTASHNPNRPLPPNQYLPIRVRKDLEFRNVYSIAKLKSVMYWKFIQGQQRVSISQVKGRWYESRSILPATNPAALQQGMAEGIIPDVGDQFNGRGTFHNGEIGDKKVDRRQAYSRSLPEGIQFGMQFSVPPPGNSVPIDLSSRDTQPSANMSDFVNMNQMEQGHFAQNFMN